MLFHHSNLSLTNHRGKASTVILVAIIALGLGAGAGYYIFNKDKPQTQTNVSQLKSTSIVGTRRPDITLTNTDNEKKSLSEWDGNVLIVNFWATWCPPCVREIPAFIDLHDEYEAKGLQIIGIAVDEKQAAIDFVDPMGVNYPILVGDMDGIALAQQYGDRLGVLPYTVIVDREGIIRHSFAREVTFEEMEKLITPLL